jgi:hypothetical protein
MPLCFVREDWMDVVALRQGAALGFFGGCTGR